MISDPFFPSPTHRNTIRALQRRMTPSDLMDLQARITNDPSATTYAVTIAASRSAKDKGRRVTAAEAHDLVAGLALIPTEPTPEPQPEPAPAPVLLDNKRASAMHRWLWTEHRIGNRDRAHHRIVSNILGREVTSFIGLSEDECRIVVRALRAGSVVAA